MEKVDVLIVGAGLAGSTLAWQLREQGCSLALIDDARPDSASRIAAGLITPITGMRLALTPGYQPLLEFAQAFYRRVETHLECELLASRPCVRIPVSLDESSRYQQRSRQMFQGLTRDPMPGLSQADFACEYPAFEMNAARLDVTTYLNASRNIWAGEFPIICETIDLAQDLELQANGVALPRLGVFARHVVMCQGYSASANPWFPQVTFNPTKGELLKVRVPGLGETRTVNCGVWITRLHGDLFQVGATYDREHLDAIPTEQGREELCSKLRRFLRRPFEVVEHLAGVRPIIDTSRAIYGLSREHPQLAYFNGLGSKGSLLAPYHASRLVECLLDGRPVDTHHDVAQFASGKR